MTNIIYIVFPIMPNKRISKEHFTFPSQDASSSISFNFFHWSAPYCITKAIIGCLCSDKCTITAIQTDDPLLYFKS